MMTTQLWITSTYATNVYLNMDIDLTHLRSLVCLFGCLFFDLNVKVIYRT